MRITCLEFGIFWKLHTPDIRSIHRTSVVGRLIIQLGIMDLNPVMPSMLF